MLLEPPNASPHQFQYDILTRLLQRGKHYLSIPLRGGEAKGRAAHQQLVGVCAALTATLDWAEANPEQAQAIATAGRALVRDVMTMDAIYDYMARVLRASSQLLRYSPEVAITSHRMIAGRPFNASNISRVPTDPSAFAQWIRNDTTYPPHARILEADWEAVVMRYNYSRMGTGFAESARKHQAEVEELRAQQRVEDERKRQATVAVASARLAQSANDAQQRRWRRAAGRGRSGAHRGARRRARHVDTAFTSSL